MTLALVALAPVRMDAPPPAASPINPEILPAMFDGDLISRWHAGRAQAPGDWMWIDLGGIRTVRGVGYVLKAATDG